MHETRTTATSKRQKCARLEPQPLRKDRNAPDLSHSHFDKGRHARDSSHSHFAKTEMRQTRATVTLKRQMCARLEPQPLRKDRNAPDSNHSHFAKTEMRQTQATTTSKMQKCARLKPQPLRKDRNAPDCQFTAALGEPGNATSDISSDDDSKAPMIQKKTIHMLGSPLRVIHLMFFMYKALCMQTT